MGDFGSWVVFGAGFPGSGEVSVGGLAIKTGRASGTLGSLRKTGEG